MATTAKHALRYPIGTDSADVPRDIQNLANDVDNKMSTYAEGPLAGRPTAGKAGRWYRQEDGAHLFLDDGEEWIEPVLATDSRIVTAATYAQGAAGSRPTASVAGRLYFATDTQELSYDTGSVWQTVSQQIGDGKLSVRTAEHTGWIIPDGRALAAGQYPHLRAVLIADGSPHGATSGNPLLPDLRGRAPIGAGGTHADVNAIGKTDGLALTARTPRHVHAHAHGHSMAHTHTGGAHTHTVGVGGSTGLAIYDASGGNTSFGGSTGTLGGHHHDFIASGSAASGGAVTTSGSSTANTGASTVPNTDPTPVPFAVCQWFVFAGPAA